MPKCLYLTPSKSQNRDPKDMCLCHMALSAPSPAGLALSILASVSDRTCQAHGPGHGFECLFRKLPKKTAPCSCSCPLQSGLNLQPEDGSCTEHTL